MTNELTNEMAENGNPEMEYDISENGTSDAAVSSVPEQDSGKDSFLNRVFSSYASFVRHFLRKNLYGIAAVIILFALGIVTGYLISSMDPLISRTIVDQMAEKLGDLDTNDPAGLFVFLLTNNTAVAFASLILGIIPAIVPIFIAYSNGIAVGAVIEMVYPEKSILAVLAGLVPHGVFELSAIFIACGAGLRLGFAPIILLLEDNLSFESWMTEIKEAIEGFVLICVPLLIIAAFIEAYFTPWFMELFL